MAGILNLSAAWPNLSLTWDYHLEEILGLVLVAGVVGLYSLAFALTERNGRGWLVSASLSFAAMAALIAASPPSPALPASHASASEPGSGE